MYYECALKEMAEQQEEIEYLKNKLVEASRRIQELEGENSIWIQRCSSAEVPEARRASEGSQQGA